MLTSLNWPTLAQCRQQERAIMIFKIIHNVMDIPVNSYLTPAPVTHDTRDHNITLMQPITRIDSYLHSVFHLQLKFRIHYPDM